MLPDSVLVVMVTVPWLKRAPPPADAEVVLLPDNVQFCTARVPALKIPPPATLTLPPEMVRPDRVALALAATLNTRLALLPERVTPTAGPVIEIVPLLAKLNSVLAKVMVFAVAKNVGSKVIGEFTPSLLA